MQGSFQFKTEKSQSDKLRFFRFVEIIYEEKRAKKNNNLYCVFSLHQFTEINLKTNIFVQLTQLIFGIQKNQKK